jgi:5-amino-6-(5-phospho-D-ribitylamino)uracil phosphatase
MPRIRLLALDIDGTLVNGQGELTETTRAAVGRARAAGVRVLLATGRRYSRVLPLFDALALEGPVVTASGALLKSPSDGHQTWYRATLAPDVLRSVVVLLASLDFEPVLYADSYGQGHDFTCRRDHGLRPELAEFMDANRADLRVEPDLIEAPPAGVFAGFTMGTREEMLQLAEALEAAAPGRLYLHVLRSPRYQGFMCEIAPRGVTKWSGVRRLADAWGVEAREICAVGDDVNDVPMIEAAGLGVAMANAPAEVRATADRIAPTNDEDGLATVVDWLLS